MSQQDSQKKAFLEYEANSWFNRNKTVLLNYKKEEDKVISLLQAYSHHPSNVLEIGCSAGYRLNGIKSVFPNVNVFGIEPSLEAINYGMQQYPEVNFVHGTIDDLGAFADNQFDLVIVGFVFYVVDRSILLKSIAEIDRVLQNAGHLIIIDFFTETTSSRNYHHIKDFSAYSFKQRYDNIFDSTKLYHLIDRSCYHHESSKLDSCSDLQELFSISLLKKDINAAFK